MNAFSNNPRTITDESIKCLKNALKELGDLSGITHDLNSDEIITGNQRSLIFNINNCKLVITEELSEPDSQGTVKRGYIIWEDKKYFYRAVRWTKEQCKKANILANKAGGNWDFDILIQNFDVNLLLECGFEKFELPNIEIGILEDLEKNGFVNTVSGNSNVFSMTFTFDKKHQDTIQNYINNNSKEILTNKILEVVYA